MDGQFRSTWDFISISDACLKIFKIPYYGFTMLSLDLALSDTCISYVSAKFLGKDLLGQCILWIRYSKRVIKKSLGTYWNKLWLLTSLRKFREIRDPKTINKWHRKFHVGLFTGLLTGLFTLLWRSLTDVSLSLFHMIPVFSLTCSVVSTHWKNYRILKNTVISHILEDTLMQICKSLHMSAFIEKRYPENFVFWILRILELVAREATF